MPPPCKLRVAPENVIVDVLAVTIKLVTLVAVQAAPVPERVIALEPNVIVLAVVLPKLNEAQEHA
jgi:hypothetical protein